MLLCATLETQIDTDLERRVLGSFITAPSYLTSFLLAFANKLEVGWCKVHTGSQFHIKVKLG